MISADWQNFSVSFTLQAAAIISWWAKTSYLKVHQLFKIAAEHLKRLYLTHSRISSGLPCQSAKPMGVSIYLEPKTAIRLKSCSSSDHEFMKWHICAPNFACTYVTTLLSTLQLYNYQVQFSRYTYLCHKQNHITTLWLSFNFHQKVDVKLAVIWMQYTVHQFDIF